MQVSNLHHQHADQPKGTASPGSYRINDHLVFSMDIEELAAGEGWVPFKCVSIIKHMTHHVWPSSAAICVQQLTSVQKSSLFAALRTVPTLQVGRAGAMMFKWRWSCWIRTCEKPCGTTVRRDS
jgi:hypothetical protein